MDAAVGGSTPLLDALPMIMPRPISPSPLWFPALQDEYFAESSAVTVAACSTPVRDSSTPSSDSVRSSSSTGVGEEGSWVAAPRPTKDGLSSSSLLTAAREDSLLVEIVGLPFERPHAEEEDDPSGLLLLLERCTSHDTMTTATTAATLSTDHTHATGGDAPPAAPAPSGMMIARSHSLDSSVHEVVQPCHHRHHHRRKSSRASRRALSAQDWDSILPHVKWSGDDNGEVEGYADEQGQGR